MERSVRRGRGSHGFRLSATRGAGALLGVIGAAAAGLGACTGVLGDPPIGQAQAPVCALVEPGPSPIRRMTRFEYNNTVRDLLGDPSQPANGFAIEEEALGFNNQAAALGVTQLLAEQYMEAAEQIAARAALDLEALIPGCDPAVHGPEACADQLIRELGRRAFRRPLTAVEVERLTDLFDWGHDELDFSAGIQLVIQAMLQSPHFLYRVEFGMPDPVEGDVVQLTHHEVASRLSYLLWSSMPDGDLLAAADAGELGTPEQLKAQAERMLEDGRARAAVANFHRQWLELSHIETITKDPATYPAYTPDLRPLWKSETEAFLDYVVFEDPAGDVATLFTAPYSFMSAELAAFYGMEGPAGAAFERVDLDPTQRAGFLTHASVLATLAKPNQSSPVHRGKFVRERLLCEILPPPPNNIEIKAPEVEEGVSTRERFSQHRDDPSCAFCHSLMDPIGFGFEHYDGIGLWRDTDQGVPVDATGEISGSRSANGSFDGAIELAHQLAESEQVRACVVAQWFRFGYGRAEQEEDRCSMDQLQQAFAESGHNIRALLVALTQTDAFRYRRAAAAGGGAP
jgi:hypothetical protein